jgi:hypothetical protein
MKTKIVVGCCAVSMLSAMSCSAETAASVSVPIEIVNNFPVLSLSIGDQEIPVAFDLGGDHQIELTPEALQKIDVQYLEETYEWIDAKGNRLKARKFIIPELRIGGAVFRNVEGHEDAEATHWPKTRAGLGRMGRVLFQSHKMVLDYQRSTIDLVSGESANVEGEGCSGHRIPFDPQWNGEPVSKVLTDFGRLTLYWDTGAPGTFVQASLLALDENAAPAKPVLSQKFAMQGRDFGPLELRPIQFSQPEGIDGFLGYNFFAKQVVCIDFAGKEFLVR